MTTTTRNFMIVLLLIDVSYAFNKCCPSGEVFTSNFSRVNCFPTPSDATELFFVDFNEDNGYPICDQPRDIATTPLNQFNFTNFVQKPFCIEILHEQSTPLNVTIVVHCESNEDRNKEGQLSFEFLSKPRFLNITRCCSNNQVFNLARGTCEPSTNEDDFLTLFPKDELRSRNIEIVSIGKRLLKCPTSTAMFTYEIDAADVTILDESLKVNVWKNQTTMESFTITGRNSCLEMTPDFRSRRRIAVRVCRDEHVCRGDNCVKKCCKHGSTRSLCETNKKHELNFYDEISNITGTPRNITEYGVMFKMIKCPEFYLEPMENLFGVSSEGELKLLPDNIYLPQDIYCLDVISTRQDNYEEKLYAFICFPDTTLQDNIRIILIIILASISFICLLLTLTVYACLPVLQNLHGKTLMSHTATLMMGYFCISISPWLHNIEQSYVLCCIGILFFFSFLSAFSWLNVMCFDIWRTFGRLQGNLTRPRKHGKRFLSYCLYAWGLPIFIVAFAFLDDYVHILPENLRPHFNKQNCWFEENLFRHGEILYFRSVVMIQLIINIVFFILTAKQYSMVKAEIKKVTMDSSDPRNKQFLSNKSKFIMNVKLFVVMGIPWITEIISSMIQRYTLFVYEQEFFYVTDVFNCLQGLLIFILFVIKRRVCEALKKRLGLDEKKKFSQTTLSLQDPFKIRKSVSNSTLTSTFAISSIP